MNTNNERVTVVKEFIKLPEVLDFESLDIVETFKEDVTINSVYEALEHNVHVAIARSIVKKIASMPKHRSNKACLDIVNSGYTQEIMADIEQTVAEALLNWYAKGSAFGVVDIADNKLVFDSYTNRKNEVKSYYIKLYSVVEAVLYDYSNHNISNNGQIIGYDAILCSDNADDKAINHNNWSYLRACAYDGGINDIIKRRDFNAFIEFMSVKSDIISKKRIKTVVNVLYCVVEGYKSEQIADILGVSIDVVKKARADIRKIYIAWTEKGGSIDIGSNKEAIFYGVTTMKSSEVVGSGYSTSIEPYSNKYSYVPSVGAMEFTSDCTNNERVYADDCVIEYRRNSSSIDVYYTNKVDIDGEKRINAVYQHTIAIK